MNSSARSLFDLSDSEKLQLVQDLWDDLSTTPASVPVHDWQREELERRKTNLLRNPASEIEWPEVKRRIRSQRGRLRRHSTAPGMHRTVERRYCAETPRPRSLDPN